VGTVVEAIRAWRARLSDEAVRKKTELEAAMLKVAPEKATDAGK